MFAKNREPRSPRIVKAEIEKLEAKLVDLRAELNATSNKYIYCQECQDFYLRDDLESSTYTKTQLETIWSDAGYGDDDILADVTRQYQDKKCPVCHSTLESKNFYIGERNRHSRR